MRNHTTNISVKNVRDTTAFLSNTILTIVFCSLIFLPAIAGGDRINRQETSVVNDEDYQSPETINNPPASLNKIDEQHEDYNSRENTINQLEQHMFELINKDRAKYHAPPVELNARLSKMARDYAQYMMQKDFFGHTDLQGHNFQYRAEQAGFMSIYENLAWQSRGDKPDKQLVDAMEHEFMAEPHNKKNHRYNILFPAHTYVGIGIVRSKDKLIAVQEYTDDSSANRSAVGEENQ